MQKSWQQIRGDMIGGVTAAVVALPLSLAFGIASGAGAVAGLYGAIFGGLVAAVFGGCGVQITGPTGAMIGVLVGIVSQYGVGGLFLAGVLAGLMQVLFGLLRLGGFVKYLPQPVIAGFTNGVAILFFMTAMDDALETLSLTIITAVVILLALRFFKRLPESLFGLLAGLVINELFIHSPHVVGDLPFHFPKPVLELMPFPEIGALLMSAFTICLLGSISALLSAEVTDEMLGVRHDSNRELIGQGLGNLVSSFIGGLPVSGAVARSGVNVHSGGAHAALQYPPCHFFVTDGPGFSSGGQAYSFSLIGRDSHDYLRPYRCLEKSETNPPRAVELWLDYDSYNHSNRDDGSDHCCSGWCCARRYWGAG